jgi:hypothetical protein
MTYLELCQALRAEAGLSGTGPASVVGQTGMYGRLVGWVQDAYAEILSMLPWSFLWARATPTLTINQTVYTNAQLGINDLGRIYAHSVRDTSTPDSPRLTFRSWLAIERMLEDGRAGPPRMFGFRPDRTLIVYPKPDAAYSLQLDYQRAGHVLVNGSDTPLIPDAGLHKIIVYKALEIYGLHNEDMTAAQQGARLFAVYLSRMEQAYGRPIDTAVSPLDTEHAQPAAELV